MVDYALPEIVQQSEVEAGIAEVETQSILPIHTAAHGISCLAIGEPFDVLHHHHQRYTPGGDVHGPALRGREIRKELIVIERAELGAQVDIQVAFGKGGLHGSCRRVWNGWKKFRA